jgi:hypothetical protein
MSLLGSGSLGLGSPASKGPDPPGTTVQKRSRAAGLIWKSLGIFLFVFAVITGVVLPSLFSLVFQKQVSGTGLIATVLIMIGLKCYLHGRRHLALTAQQSLAEDPRPPVLYLRSFGDDKSAGRVPTGGLLRHIGLSASLFDLKTEEELIADSFREFGPVVCIGKPGEKLPELGAARIYESHTEWQEKVRDFMTKAKLVVLRLGDTPGFWWEVERSVKTIEPKRLVLLVPFGKRKYQKFAEKAAQHFPQPLPKYSARRNFLGIRYTRALGKLRGFIYFKDDWTPQYVDLVRVKWPWKMKPRFIGRRRIIQKFKWGLRPVFDQAGVPWTPPPTRVFLTILFVLAMLLFVGGPLVTAGYVGTFYWMRARGEANYKKAESAYVARVENSPEFQAANGSLSPEQATAKVVDLSRNGILRLDDQELIQRAGIVQDALATRSDYDCAQIAMSGVHKEDFKIAMGAVSDAKMQEWFRLQGDAAMAEMRNSPPVVVEDTEAPYKALREYLDQLPGGRTDNFGRAMFVLSGNADDSDAKSFYAAFQVTTYGMVHASVNDICADVKTLQKAALVLPAPQNGQVARELALVEK